MADMTGIQVLACTDCAGMRAFNVSDLWPSAEEPCGCGCGWFRLLCQMCGRIIGEATRRGTIDLCNRG